jgi:uncharacterized membrane protein YciS (DUF1049 family)
LATRIKWLCHPISKRIADAKEKTMHDMTLIVFAGFSGIIAGWITLGLFWYRYRTKVQAELEKLKSAARMISGK